MNRFREFMYGRYGFDQFSRALVVVSLLLSVFTIFIKVSWLTLLLYIPLIYVFYRMMSKDIQRRTRENMAYCRIADQAKKRLVNLKLSLVGTKTHVYYKCSHCKQTIRVPRGKGKICITCPKCKAEFVKRT
jgi:predicted membrane protein